MPGSMLIEYFFVILHSLVFLFQNYVMTVMNLKKLMLSSAIASVFCVSGAFISCSNNDGPDYDPTLDSSQFVNLTDVVPDAILEIRYYGTYNFVGARIDGYEQPVALITKQAAAALKEVSDDLHKQGYRLKIFDAYRPQKAVDHFVRWAADLSDEAMKPYFYPYVNKSDLFKLDYICLKSGHTRGSTLDLTLFDMKTEKEVDMGFTFDWFGVESHPDFCGNPETGEYNANDDRSPSGSTITSEQFANRLILRRAMLAHGFNPFDTEWWHFTLKNEPFQDTYFNFPVKQLPQK